MQVSDLVGQYNSAAARQEMTGTKGVRKLVSTLRDMKSGNIFEGTVNSVKGGKVTLALPNGQEVTARMDGKVKLSVGQSMFFQVKANDGSQIAIRPYTIEGNSINLTLMEALKAANLLVDGRNLSMVNSMMEEQMSIDRNNLAQMARIVSGNPDIDVKTLVQMQKLEIPITPQMAAQFQNYLDDKQAIGKALTDFMDAIGGALADGELSAPALSATAGEILAIVTDGLSEEVELPAPPELPAEEAALQQSAEGGQETVTAAGAQPVPEEEAAAQTGAAERQAGAAEAAGEPPQEAAQAQTARTDAQPLAQTAPQAQEAVQGGGETPVQGAPANGAASGGGTLETTAAENPVREQPVMNEAFLQEELNEAPTFPAHTLGSVLDEKQMQELAKQLQRLSYEGEISPQDSTVAVLNAIKAKLGGMPEKEGLQSLVSGKEFQALVKDALEQQWMIKPQELAQKDKVAKLYEKLETQLDKLEEAVKNGSHQSEELSRLAADIKSNVQFMNQINQAYTYVQIPLKMAGQNTNGELYVYTNKKNIAQNKEELTAFLHLDMDNLGSTDVSVRMRGKNVSTNFYFDNDEAFALVEAHAPILEERLKAKGYHCDVKVVNEQKKVNFVEDFLKKDQKTAGQVHRYSFDMRA